jgi:mono/diheme cytochrome c family protein
MLPGSALGQAEATYKAQCSKCHGIDGSASTPAGKKLGAADLRSQKIQALPDDKLFATIAYGAKHKEYPHAFARRGLETKQIAELVLYIRKLSPSK